MSDQFEYQCPQCRHRTVIQAEQSQDEIVYCPKCEVPMTKKAAVSQVAEASANAPTRSAGPGAAAGGRKASASKSASKTASKTGTKTARSGRATKASAVAAPVVVVTIPEFGNFRCPCCGMAKTIAPGEGKPGAPPRCQTCFVKLDFVK